MATSVVTGVGAFLFYGLNPLPGAAGKLHFNIGRDSAKQSQPGRLFCGGKSCRRAEKMGAKFVGAATGPNFKILKYIRFFRNTEVARSLLIIS
jgi:hypothetical protein